MPTTAAVCSEAGVGGGATNHAADTAVRVAPQAWPNPAASPLPHPSHPLHPPHPLHAHPAETGSAAPSSTSPLVAHAPCYGSSHGAAAVGAWHGHDGYQPMAVFAGMPGHGPAGVDTHTLSNTLLMDMSELSYMNHGFMESWEDFVGLDTLS